MIVIGWIGSQSTFKYLSEIKDVLKRLSENYAVEVHIIGTTNTSLGLGKKEIHVNWSEETEVVSILKFDIGIMPLPDTPWEQGKCAYKLIQYMACGLPVVASAVGMNKEVVKEGYSGFLVRTEQEWYDCLEKYINNSELRKEHGRCGRQIVSENYCIEATISIIKQLFVR